ncbi:MAG: sugar-binding protein [Flavobacteriales bacterium]
MQDTRPNVHGFYPVSIYSDAITNDLWHTPNSQCIEVKKNNESAYSGESSIEIKWNKQADGCPWLGLGVGWENWTGKDISGILSKAAVSFWVKSLSGDLQSGLPWAIGFEDFIDGQAWTGITKDCVIGGVITSEWTHIQVPLENFPFEQNDVEPHAIKQLMLQFESSGKVCIDEITIIPFEPKQSKIGQAIEQKTNKATNGLQIPDSPENVFRIGDHSMRVCYDFKGIQLTGKISDNTPMQNMQSGKDIWNGDALEIAFGTDASADAKRRIFYPSDCHIGIKLDASGMVFDWINNRIVENTKVVLTRNDNFVEFDITIPWESLQVGSWERGMTYGFEWAVDDGDTSGKRISQSRWNSEFKEGFNTNPSMWGRITALDL